MSEQDKGEYCLACDVPLKVGDEYLPDINGGLIHFACCGPEAAGFVDLETGDPLTKKPEPLIWTEEDLSRDQ